MGAWLAEDDLTPYTVDASSDSMPDLRGSPQIDCPIRDSRACLVFCSCDDGGTLNSIFLELGS